MSAAPEHWARSSGLAGEPERPVLRRGGVAYWLSGLLAVTATADALLTFLVPGVLRGPAAMNRSALGIALVVVLLGGPVLAVSMTLAWAGTARALLRWLGAAAFMLYDSVLFLLDVAMLGLAVWSVGTVLWQTDVAGLGRRPARGWPSASGSSSRRTRSPG